MTIKEMSGHLKEHWPAIREQLLNGTYTPQPVKRMEIPKPDGGVRKLGIPTVLVSPIPIGYNSRRAVATGRRAARTAGSRPPIRPMTRANTMPFANNSGVILKAKARLEKV